MQTRSKTDLGVVERAQRYFSEYCSQLYAATDRLFAMLMILQWIGGILLAMYVSPRTWSGGESQVHVHFWAAVFLGGAISLAPIILAFTMPGSTITRHVIAIAQMSWSSLLIHLSGGRIETHFHVFGSLAFIAFYRDWRVLVTATLVTTVDHVTRGVFWPQSVYGVIWATPFRSLEHAAWVVFEDIFLLISCNRSLQEAYMMCARRGELEHANVAVERSVTKRTQELEEARNRLEHLLVEQTRTQKEREQLYSDLASVSRRAGMAEVATGVLHNVGNILNSLNVSAEFLLEKARRNDGRPLRQVTDLLKKQGDQLGTFFESDPRGQKLPVYIGHLSASMDRNAEEAVTELRSLVIQIDHIKQIVSMQQGYARPSSLVEPVVVADVIKTAVEMNDVSLKLHAVAFTSKIEDIPEITTDKHKLIQILVNLLKNAVESVCEMETGNREVSIELFRTRSNQIAIRVIDNGLGIEPGQLPRMFSHGFTTKRNGHGFGLHNCSLAIRDLGGSLSVDSEGIGCGATFTMTLPISPKSLEAPTEVAGNLGLLPTTAGESVPQGFA